MLSYLRICSLSAGILTLEMALPLTVTSSATLSPLGNPNCSLFSRIARFPSLPASCGCFLALTAVANLLFWRFFVRLVYFWLDFNLSVIYSGENLDFDWWICRSWLVFWIRPAEVCSLRSQKVLFSKIQTIRLVFFWFYIEYNELPRFAALRGLFLSWS